MKTMIEASNLAHEYFRRDEEGNVTGVNRALDGISLKVKEGDFIAVLGSNGSGKSTFAKHINALLAPTEGTLYVGGMDSSNRTVNGNRNMDCYKGYHKSGYGTCCILPLCPCPCNTYSHYGSYRK